MCLMLTCMKEEDRDLLDHIINEYCISHPIKKGDLNRDIYGAFYWLVRYSKIFSSKNKEALEWFGGMMKKVNENSCNRCKVENCNNCKWEYEREEEDL